MKPRLFDSKQDVGTLKAMSELLLQEAAKTEGQGMTETARTLRGLSYQLQDEIDALLEDMKRHIDEINEYAVWEVVNEDEI